MNIVYKPHLLRRLKERKIPKTYPRKIILKPEYRYFDSQTMHYISIRKLKYAKSQRSMVAVYDIIEDEIQVITTYPILSPEIKNKVSSGRCKIYEKD